MEDELSKYPGVTSTEVGYTGGHTSHPTYEQVCSASTGHAEAVQVTFDPAKTSYKNLIIRFLRDHNPAFQIMSSNTGQYRTSIFFESSEQQRAAADAIAQYEKETSRHVFVALSPAGTFWRAEEYHQHYNKKHGAGFCRLF